MIDVQRIMREHRTQFQRYLDGAEAELAQAFKGVTAGAEAAPGLFPIERTGVSTAPLRAAAQAFLAALTPEQREKTLLPIGAAEWRRWSNVHMTLMRHGLCFVEMGETQRAAAFELLRQSMSGEGFRVARDIMRLNQVMGDITDRHDDFGEELYWLSLFGAPSGDAPWGWQLDGHHLNVSYFVLGDQVVMTPSFMGSEPVFARSGKYAGTRVMEAEQRAGLNLIGALDAAQRAKAIIGDKPLPDIVASAYRDNLVLGYEGIRAAALTSGQQELLVRAVETYAGYLRPGHAEVRLDEVKRHLPQTYFAWAGELADDAQSTFYYRVHSPVILIEFDHPSISPIRPEVAAALKDGDTLGAGRHTQNHVHTIVRTPNGNDYGRDLLRQHYEREHGAKA